MNQLLNTIHAEIAWQPEPWEQIEVIDRRDVLRIVPKEKAMVLEKQGLLSGDLYIKCKTRKSYTYGGSGKGMMDVEHQLEAKRLTNPAQDDPNLWQAMSTLYHAFYRKDDKTINEIGNFYRNYGPLRVKPFNKYLDPWEGGDIESWDHVSAALEWFNLLSQVISRWLSPGEKRDRRAGVLRDNLFSRGSALPVSEDGTCDISAALLFSKLGYEISYHPTRFIKFEENKIRLADPGNEEELYGAAWDALVRAVQWQIEKIKMEPYLSGPGEPLRWHFRANGAFEAAFLQWYFRELAFIEFPKCKREDCTNRVRPKQKKGGSPKVYCSNTCRNTVTKRRNRPGGQKKRL